MNLKRTVKSLLGSMGLYVHFQPRDALPEHLYRLFGQLDINIVIDVGGHYGEFGLLLRHFGYRGRIASFEPASEALGKLRSCAQKDYDWRVFDCALGREQGELDINVSSQTVFNSFLSATPFSLQQFKGGADVVRKERVRIDTLDRMF